MLAVILSLILCLVGSVVAIPGALPVAANRVVLYGRIAMGCGFILCSFGVCTHGVEPLTGIGLLICAVSVALTSYAIYRQACAK